VSPRSVAVRGWADQSRRRGLRSYPFVILLRMSSRSNSVAAIEEPRRRRLDRSSPFGRTRRRTSFAGPHQVVTVLACRSIFQTFQLTPLMLLEFRPIKKKVFISATRPLPVNDRDASDLLAEVTIEVSDESLE
jgi:hypothetical protein